MADVKFVAKVLLEMGQIIEEQKDYLTKLDQPIGDSDHGINMARGFQAVKEKLEADTTDDIGAKLKTVGMALVSTVGGASGPLYGSAFLKAGMLLAGKTEMNLQDFVQALKVATEAVEQRGKAVAEDATMLDAMIPAVAAMEKELADGADDKAVLQAGCAAAWKGAEHTKELVAKKGRASYVGERGIGHQDPGATSFAYLLETVERCL